MIRPGQLRAYGSAVMPEDDLLSGGGAIDLSTSVEFTDLDVNSVLQGVSSNASDTIVVDVTGRNSGGFIVSESLTLTGQTPVLTSQVFERVMKVVKQSSSLGDIAIEKPTAFATGTAQGMFAADVATLSALATDPDDAYNGMVFRVTAGTGAGFVARVLGYLASQKLATLDRTPPVPLDNTSVYRISVGVILSVGPSEIMTVRRPFYNVAADLPGGADRFFYEKFFWRNNSIETLTLVSVIEALNPTTRIDFALEAVQNGSGTSINRRTAPMPMLTFNRSDKPVPTFDLGPSSSIGVWLRLYLPAGTSPVKSLYASRLSGQTT